MPGSQGVINPSEQWVIARQMRASSRSVATIDENDSIIGHEAALPGLCDPLSDLGLFIRG